MYRNLIILTFCLLFACTEKPKEICFEEPEIADSSVVYKEIFRATSFEKIDSFFVNNHDRGQFNGTVLIAWKNTILYENALGYSDLKNKEKLRLNYTFQLASISKPLTAIAILQLCRKEIINLKDPVEKYIGQFPYTGITIEMLLTHRSGLSNYMYFCDKPDTLWPDKYKTMRNDDAISIMNSIVPASYYPPDTKYDYNNTNYILLAKIVEIASNMSFEEYMEKHVFAAANMKTARIYNRENKSALVLPAKGYNSAGKEEDDLYLNGCVGDKGVYGSAYDLFSLDSTLRTGGLLPKSWQEEAYAPRNESKDNRNYGYGWRIAEESNQGKIVFHTGWWKGFRTYFIRLIEREQLIVVLTNIKQGPFFGIEELASLLDELKIN
ncbi:MAG: serine hydrolase domain-containing protein [Flavobacteriales bacterium]